MAVCDYIKENEKEAARKSEKGGTPLGAFPGCGYSRPLFLFGDIQSLRL